MAVELDLDAHLLIEKVILRRERIYMFLYEYYLAQGIYSLFMRLVVPLSFIVVITWKLGGMFYSNITNVLLLAGVTGIAVLRPFVTILSNPKRFEDFSIKIAARKDGLFVENEDFKTLIAWDAIKSMKNRRNYILFTVPYAKEILLPKRLLQEKDLQAISDRAKWLSENSM